MENFNQKRKKIQNNINKQNINKKESNFILEYPLECNSYSDDDIFENTYNNNNNNNNNITQLEYSLANNNNLNKNKNKNKIKNTTKTKPLLKENIILIPSHNNNIIKNINYNLHNTLKQSNSNNNCIRKISNSKINEKDSKNEINMNKNQNKFAKIKNAKKKKEINSIKGNNLKYKSLKYMIENQGNKILKGKIVNKKDITKSENNLFYNKYVKEENKMINYNYFVLNPKNIPENKKTEKNLVQNIIKYPINKVQGNTNDIPKNKTKNKNKDLYIYLRNSFNKENIAEKDDYLTNTKEVLYNNTINPDLSLIETINNTKNINYKINKENIKQFSRTFLEIKEIKTIEPKENDNINNNILRQSKKNVKSYIKKCLNNSITQNNNISNNNRVKKKDLSLKIFLDKNNINNILKSNNNNKEAKTPINTNEIIHKEKNIKKYSYNNSSNNTINSIINNKTMTNKNMVIPSLHNIKNKNFSLNQKQKQNKKSRIIIYKKRKISNHKCQSKIKEINLNENDNSKKNYFTENKNIKSDNLNNFIQLRKNMKKIELFKVLTSERKNLNQNNNNNIINNNISNNNINIKKEEKQSSNIYMKSILTKWKNNAKNLSSFSNNSNSNKITNVKTKVINKFLFQKKYYNFLIKKGISKISYIEKRYKFRAPINKLCIFSKNIILKEGEGNNTIMELSSSKFNNTNKNMELLEEGEFNENEDFNVEEYEKNNSLLNLTSEENINININNNSTKGKQIINEIKPKKNMFKIEEGLEKLCRIFFRNLELKNKQNKQSNKEELKINKNLNLKKEKSDSNINFKIKNISGLFSSTIQNWNFIDKKNYKKENDNMNEIKIIKNKKKKRKKHSLLLNIHKAFSEEKIRDQLQMERRTVNLNSKLLFWQNQNELALNQTKNKNNNNKEVIDPKNNINKIINKLNKENYNTILADLFELISNKTDEKNININYNNYEILLNNQFTFVEVVVEKTVKEKKENLDMSLISKLCYDLYIRFNSDFIYLNKKKTKGENLKSILKTECKQKFDECDIITLLNISKINFANEKGKNFYEKIKNNLFGIIDFIAELIQVKMISQKMGLEYLDILKKRINNFDNDIKDLKNIEGNNNLKDIKNLYFEGEINLLKKISKIIIERKKPKHLQNLKNFIEDNIIPIITDKKKNQINQNLATKFKDFLTEIKKNEFFKDIKYDNTDEKNMILLKEEILDYIKLSTENEKNKEKKININDEFNWNIIDDLITNKNLSLDIIIVYYIEICKEIIYDNSQVFKANEYIKSVINYYSENLSKESINKLRLNIIKIFFDIDYYCNNDNIYMHKIIGLILFVLITNNVKLFNIKDLNNYLNTDINTRINLAKVSKFTIIAFGRNWKRYFNIFKKTNFFYDSDIFNEYISNPMKLNGFI